MLSQFERTAKLIYKRRDNGSLNLFPLAFFVTAQRSFVQQYLERDTAEEEQRGDQEDEARSVFADDRQGA